MAAAGLNDWRLTSACVVFRQRIVWRGKSRRGELLRDSVELLPRGSRAATWRCHLMVKATRRSDLFSRIAEAPPDPILGTAVALQADVDPRKVDLGIAACRNEDGKQYMLPSVQEAEVELLLDLRSGSACKEYSTIIGPEHLQVLTQRLLVGLDAPCVTEQRVVSFQVLSGAWACAFALNSCRSTCWH